MKVYTLTHSSGCIYEGGSDDLLAVYTDFEMLKLVGIEYAKLWLKKRNSTYSKVEFPDLDKYGFSYLELGPGSISSDYDNLSIREVELDDESFLEEYKYRYSI